MTEELKEILDELRYYAKRYEEIVNGEEYLDKNGFIVKTIDDIDKNILNEYKNKKIFLDYITNLQEENEKLIDLINEYENKGYDIGQERADFLLRIQNYKHRIDKAIEYIEGWQSFPHTNYTTHNELKNLMSILRGESYDR